MAKMIKATKSDAFIIFQTVARDDLDFRCKCKSPNFYFYRDKLLSLEPGQRIIEEDIVHYCNFFHGINYIVAQFTWMKSGTEQGSYRAWRETVHIDPLTFKEWLHGETNTYRALDQGTKNKSSKLVFTDSAQQVLRNILQKPVLRKKFLKTLKENFMRSGNRTVTFHKDHDDYSFYWQEKLASGENTINGGLILHRGHDDDNFENARYSVHT